VDRPHSPPVVGKSKNGDSMLDKGTFNQGLGSTNPHDSMEACIGESPAQKIKECSDFKVKEFSEDSTRRYRALGTTMEQDGSHLEHKWD
jgi:hypothetical protein